MPVMIEKGTGQGRETSGADPDSERPGSIEPTHSRTDSCACDHCQAPARDEMWTRWA